MNLILLLASFTMTFHAQEMTELGMGYNTCTAVMVSKNQAITSAHCVTNTPLFGKMMLEVNGKKYGAKYITADPNVDLALVEIHGTHTYAKIGAMPQRGDKVVTLNSGDDLEGTYNEGIVNNLIVDKEYKGIHMILFNAAIQKGASGGGLYNMKGELIGINTLAYEGLSEAVDTNTIKKFLKKNHVDFR